MSQSVKLPDDVFNDLRNLAEASNVTPEEWIAARVSAERPKEFKERPLAEALEGRIGVVDSSGNPNAQYRRDAFSKILVAKPERQGLKFSKG